MQWWWSISLSLFIFTTSFHFLVSGIWVNLTVVNEPTSRDFPTIAYSSSSVFFYGGITNSTYLNDTYLVQCNERTMTFSNAIVSSSRTAAPYMGAGASATWNKKTSAFYVFGGQKRTSPSGSSFCDAAVWKFSYEHQRWSMVYNTTDGSSGPSPRYFHAACSDEINNKMIIGGGKQGVTDKLLNDLWSFDYVTFKWSPILYEGDSISSRWGHAMVYFPSKILIFAGFTSVGPTNDLYMINFTETQLNNTNTLPVALNEATCSKIQYLNQNPTQPVPPLYYPIALQVSQVSDSKLLLFGGLLDSKPPSFASSSSMNPLRSTDLFVYSLQNNTFSVVNDKDPLDWPYVAFLNSYGIYFYDVHGWVLFKSGECADGQLDLHEQCDDGNYNLGDNCEKCSIQLCGNKILDTGEDCDSGPLCTSSCTCPEPFFSDRLKRNGCYPESSPIAFILMLVVPVFLGITLIGIIINFVMFTQKEKKSIVKVLFL